MSNGKNFKESMGRIQMRQAFWLPFALIIAGIYILQTIPYNVSKLDVHQGIIKSYTQDVDKPICIYVYEEKEPFIVKYVKNRKLLSNVLNKDKAIKIWTKKPERYGLQIEIDGQMVFKHNPYSGIWFGIVPIIVGGVLIPFFIRARRKHAKYFGDE